jgi:hypothetical protein
MRLGEGQPDRPVVGCVGRRLGGVLVFGCEGALYLVDDQAGDAGQAFDGDDVRVDRADLLGELGFALRGDLSAEHDEVDVLDVVAAGDVGEVVCCLGGVAEVAQADDRVVDDQLAAAEHENAAVCVVGRHVSSCVF